MFFDNFFFTPEVTVQVLYPFEVTYGYTATICQNIRYNKDTFFSEDCVSIRSGRTICTFRNDLCFNISSVFFGELQFHCTRRKNGYIHSKKFCIGNFLSTGIAYHATSCLYVFFNIVAVKAFRIINCTTHVTQSNYFYTFIIEEFSSPATNITKTLYGNSCILGSNAFNFKCFESSSNYTTTSCSSTTKGTTYANCFTGDEARFILTGNFAIFIHHPAHNLSISVHIRCGNIFLFANKHSNSINVCSSQSFQFAFGKSCRIYDNATFATAIRQTCYCAFAGHPESESFNFVHGYILMIAHATFCRAKYGAVLATIAGENFGSTIIHFQRNRNFKSAFRNCDNCCSTRI